MDFLLRCTVLSLAAFSVAYGLSAVAAAWRWRVMAQDGAATVRADRLLLVRVLPALAAAAVLLFVLVGLYRFESREGDEVIGWLLWAFSLTGAWLVAGTAWRATRMHRETARLVGTWMRGAAPLTVPGLTIPAFRIDTGFPIVAVVGVRQPRLVIDTRVLQACDADELRAIVAHEHGHLRRHDNLRRLAFAAVPGLMGADGLPRAWRDATEEAADDLAAAGSPDARFHLASALLRVSRLAASLDAGAWQAQMPASALFRGENVERRVRRLMDAGDEALTRRHRWTPTAMCLLAGVAFFAQRDIHELMERVVALLP